MSAYRASWYNNSMDETMFGKGALDRPEDFLKPEALQHSEIAGAFQPAPWIEKKLGEFVTYPKRNQGMKQDCTCYSAAKALAIDELSENGQWREFSPDHVYPYVVVPGGGARSLDVANFIVEKGMTLEALYPSDKLTEEQAADPMVKQTDIIAKDAKQVAMIYRPAKAVECPTDFETIASIIHGFRQQGLKKGVMVTIVGQNNGTWLSTFPVAPSKDSKAALWFHRVVVTDFGLIDGKKVLAFDNSWGDQIGHAGQQFLTLEYEQFVYGGIYTIDQPDVSALSPMPKPNYTWAAHLQVGSRGPDVLALQTALQSIGMFPVSSIVKPTGYFGGITKEAVELFQANFGETVNGIVDDETIIALNNIFK